jgi:hypothetical protein
VLLEDGDQGILDPRLLVYKEMLEQSQAGRDSAAAREADFDRRRFLESVREMVELEDHLDRLELLLDEQEGRLWKLEADFLERRETSLLILMRGAPEESVRPTRLVLTDDSGDTTTVGISPARWSTLEQGAIAQLHYTFVEPREQVLELALYGTALEEPVGSLVFVPQAERINFLELDFSRLSPREGALAVLATTWVENARMPDGDR